MAAGLPAEGIHWMESLRNTSATCRLIYLLLSFIEYYFDDQKMHQSSDADMNLTSAVFLVSLLAEISLMLSQSCGAFRLSARKLLQAGPCSSFSALWLSGYREYTRYLLVRKGIDVL